MNFKLPLALIVLTIGVCFGTKLSPEVRKVCVDFHNKYHSSSTGYATKPLEYDELLERDADEEAEGCGCGQKHKNSYKYVGTPATTPIELIKSAIVNWWKPKAENNGSVVKSNELSSFSKVGCATNLCENGKFVACVYE